MQKVCELRQRILVCSSEYGEIIKSLLTEITTIDCVGTKEGFYSNIESRSYHLIILDTIYFRIVHKDEQWSNDLHTQAAKCLVLTDKTLDSQDRIYLSAHEIGVMFFQQNKLVKLRKNIVDFLELINFSDEPYKVPCLCIDDEINDIQQEKIRQFMSEEAKGILAKIIPVPEDITIKKILKIEASTISFIGMIGQRPIPVFIKIGEKDDIIEEYKNYREYIYLHVINYPLLERHYNFRKMGGLLYSLLGVSDEIMTFSEFYLKEDVEKIIQTLSALFENNLNKLYESTSPTNRSLFELYEYYRLPDQLLSGQIEISTRLNTPNPFLWVNLNKAKIIKNGRRVFLTARTHGDLWGENILIDNNDCWVIDFRRSGWGHDIRDFVELEVDILTRLCKIDHINEKTFLTLLTFLLQPEHETKFTIPYIDCILPSLLLGDDEAVKACKVIIELRNIAWNQFHFRNIQNYYLAILLDCIFISTRNFSSDVWKTRVMEYASLICFRLDNWEKGTNWTIDEWLKKSGIDESKGPKNTYDSKDNKLPDVWG